MFGHETICPVPERLRNDNHRIVSGPIRELRIVVDLHHSRRLRVSVVPGFISESYVLTTQRDDFELASYLSRFIKGAIRNIGYYVLVRDELYGDVWL